MDPSWEIDEIVFIVSICYVSIDRFQGKNMTSYRWHFLAGLNLFTLLAVDGFGIPKRNSSNAWQLIYHNFPDGFCFELGIAWNSLDLCFFWAYRPDVYEPTVTLPIRKALIKSNSDIMQQTLLTRIWIKTFLNWFPFLLESWKWKNWCLQSSPFKQRHFSLFPWLWIYFSGDVLLCTMLNHHRSPPFGRICLGHFFHPHLRSESRLIMGERVSWLVNLPPPSYPPNNKALFPVGFTWVGGGKVDQPWE